MLVLHCILCTLYYRTTGTTMKETPQKDKEEGAAGPFVIPLEGEARGFFRPGAPKNIQRRETDNPVSNEVVASEGNKDSYHYQTKRGRFSLFLSVRPSARPEKSLSVPATETRTRRRGGGREETAAASLSCSPSTSSSSFSSSRSRRLRSEQLP